MAIPGFTAERSLASFPLRYRLMKARAAGAYSRLRPMQGSEGYCLDSVCIPDGPGGGGGGGNGGGGGGGNGSVAPPDGATDGTAGNGTTDGTIGDGTTDGTVSDGTASDTGDGGTPYTAPDAGDTPPEPGEYRCDDYNCRCWDLESCNAMDRDNVCQTHPAGYAWGGCTTTPGCGSGDKPLLGYPDCPCTCDKILIS